MAKRPTLNKIKTRIEDMQIYLRAERKFGKTTLFRDIVLEKFGNPECGCLIKVGYEDGDSLLDAINSVDVQTYDELLELGEWLVKEKGKEHQIKMVGLDVADELIPLVEKYIVAKARKEEGKPLKSILQVDGGYNRGPIKAAQELKRFFRTLKDAGLGVICIAHTKTKKVKPKGSMSEEEGYDMFTSTLSATYEAVFGDIFDIVLTGAIDREVTDGKLTSANRYLYLRSDGFVEAGGRMAFGTAPDRILFDKANMAKDVVTILEDAMAKSSVTGVVQQSIPVEKPIAVETPMAVVSEPTPSEIAKDMEITIEPQVVEEVKEEVKIDVERNKQLLTQIQSKFKGVGPDKKKEVKQIISGYGFAKFDVDNMETKVFEEALAVL